MKVERGEHARRGIALAIWFALLWRLGWLGERVVPDSVKVKISFQTFLMACQIATLVLGLGATLLIVRRRREALGLDRLPSIAGLASTLAAVPLAFVASSYAALQIALPVLLEELRTRGAAASQQNAGAFGRALTQTPLLLTLLWGALLGALGEELFFRGLLWTTITDLTKRLSPKSAARDGEQDDPAKSAPNEANESTGEEAAAAAPSGNAYAPPASARERAPAAMSLRDRALAIVLEGGVATVLCALLFGWMHKDLPGGVGIVRFWSTTFLGFFSGLTRQITGSVLCCILLHLAYNTIAIGSGQKWFAAKEEHVLEGIPNILLLLAVLGVLAIGFIAFLRALRARRAQSAF